MLCAFAVVIELKLELAVPLATIEPSKLVVNVKLLAVLVCEYGLNKFFPLLFAILSWYVPILHSSIFPKLIGYVCDTYGV